MPTANSYTSLMSDSAAFRNQYATYPLHSMFFSRIQLHARSKFCVIYTKSHKQVHRGTAWKSKYSLHYATTSAIL